MILQYVTLIDQGRQVVATAQVTGQDGSFTGRINLSCMPVPLRRLGDYSKNTRRLSIPICLVSLTRLRRK